MHKWGTLRSPDHWLLFHRRWLLWRWEAGTYRDGVQASGWARTAADALSAGRASWRANDEF